MSVVDPRKLKPADYDSLVNRLVLFFAGVTTLNKRILDDAMATINTFIDELTSEPVVTPPPPTPVEPPTPPQQNTKLTPTFIASLTRNDLLNGGHRHRQTAQGLIHWDVRYRMISLESGIINTRKWSNGWVSSLIKSVGNKFGQSIIAYVNKIKTSTGASYVLQFNLSKTTEFFLIFDTN